MQMFLNIIHRAKNKDRSLKIRGAVCYISLFVLMATGCPGCSGPFSFVGIYQIYTVLESEDSSSPILTDGLPFSLHYLSLKV